MAEIRRITRSNPLSDFRNTSAMGNPVWAMLGETMRLANERFEPAAMEEMRRQGVEAGMDAAGDVRTAVPGDANPVGGLEAPTDAPRPDDERYRYGPPKDTAPAWLIDSESGGRFTAQNDVPGAGGTGHFGRVQFSRARLDEAKAAGVVPQDMTPEQFLASPDVQRAAEDWHFKDIRTFIQQNGLETYVGQTINGVPVTMDGMIGVAHLGGQNGLKRFLETGGAYNPSDANGTSLTDYLGRGARGSTSPSAGSARQPEVVIRTADGTLEPRLYSPLAGPIRQAYNTAAKATFLAQKTTQGVADFLALSNQFKGDPDGFASAADEYIRTSVQGVSTEFRADLRAELTQEMQSRYLGMVDERYALTRQRAANEIGALVDRYSADYAQAKASGNTAAAEAARAKLESALYARENLPGSTWTRAQSENSILSADSRAAKILADRQVETAAGWKDALTLARDAAKKGETAEGESLLNDPAVQAAHPDLFLETQYAVAVRDFRPEFFAAPPAEQAAILDELRSKPVQSKGELFMVEAMQAAHDETLRALDDDPVQFAEDKFLTPPPPMPTFTGDLEAFQADLTSWAAARKDFALGMVAQGYTTTPEFLSKAERESFSFLGDKETPPAARAAAALAVVNGAGTQAKAMLQEMGASPVLAHAAGLVSMGQDQIALQKAALGEERMATEGIRLPDREDRLSGMDEKFMEAGPYIPGVRGALMATAEAIYAADAIPNADPNSMASKERFAEAFLMALGQHKSGEKTLGGIQDVELPNGTAFPTLLPPSISAEMVASGFRQAMGRPGTVRGQGGGVETPGADPRPELWGDAGVPHFGGQPLTREQLANVRIRPVATPYGISATRYRMEYISATGALVDVSNADGNVFIFDIETLTGRR